MKWKDMIFAAVAVIVPVGTSEFVQLFLGKESNFSQTVISSIIAFILLLLIQIALNAHNRLNKYFGQWVETMTQYEGNQEKERLIGIGLIRHDRMTGEHVFTGKTYSLDGEEKYAWSINYLCADRDDSMQYVCSVQIPSERSIGQITFYNKNECEGVIWCMNGVWYKYSAYRITRKTFSEIDFIAPVEALPKRFHYRGIMVGQKYGPEFVQRYSQKFEVVPFFELFYRKTGLFFCPIPCNIWLSGFKPYERCFPKPSKCKTNIFIRVSYLNTAF